jgi:hypothetical protein
MTANMRRGGAREVCTSTPQVWQCQDLSEDYLNSSLFGISNLIVFFKST